MLLDESNIVIERVNGATVTETNLLQLAIDGILAKKSRQDLAKLLGSLNLEARLHTVEEDELVGESGLPRLLPQGYGKG